MPRITKNNTIKCYGTSLHQKLKIQDELNGKLGKNVKMPDLLDK